MQRVLWIALALAACGPATPAPSPPPGSSHATPGLAPITTSVPADAGPPPPLDHDMPRLAERSLRMYEDVASALSGAPEDCPGATGKLRAVEEANADVIVAIARVAKDGRAKDLHAQLTGRAKALQQAAKTIAASPALARCAADKPFADALDGLVGSAP